jgi:DNA-binding XRE family transcriptional regulator
MDKRRKVIDRDVERAVRQKFYEDIDTNALNLAQAVKAMRRVSRLTQIEFAAHRGIGLKTLKQIEAGEGNPSVETLNKIGEIFGVEIGFVRKK